MQHIAVLINLMFKIINSLINKFYYSFDFILCLQVKVLNFQKKVL